MKGKEMTDKETRTESSDHQVVQRKTAKKVKSVRDYLTSAF